MSQAVVDPAELRRFAHNLKVFNEDLRSSLHADERPSHHDPINLDFALMQLAVELEGGRRCADRLAESRADSDVQGDSEDDVQKRDEHEVAADSEHPGNDADDEAEERQSHP